MPTQADPRGARTARLAPLSADDLSTPPRPTQASHRQRRTEQKRLVRCLYHAPGPLFPKQLPSFVELAAARRDCALPTPLTMPAARGHSTLHSCLLMLSLTDGPASDEQQSTDLQRRNRIKTAFERPLRASSSRGPSVSEKQQQCSARRRC